MELIELDTVTSTSSLLSAMADTAPHGTVVIAREQTAGRGQRGNSWEAEPGANITLSLLLRPAGLHPSRQFVISQAVSLAIAEMLDAFVAEPRVSIKWPNDIYVGDRKICGILIENAVTGSGINHCIVGIGLNVNQMQFMSDAPNPVSLRQLMPEIEFDVASLAGAMVTDILGKIDEALAGEAAAPAGDGCGISRAYFARLWRNDGWYPYHDNVRDAGMMARIDSVAPTGHITLTDRADGIARTYAFKEISAILDNDGHNPITL